MTESQRSIDFCIVLAVPQQQGLDLQTEEVVLCIVLWKWVHIGLNYKTPVQSQSSEPGLTRKACKKFGILPEVWT